MQESATCRFCNVVELGFLLLISQTTTPKLADLGTGSPGAFESIYCNTQYSLQLKVTEQSLLYPC
jgi:hypothetical protein